MTIEAGLTEFAEYLGGEIRRVENKIPTVGGQSNSPASAQIIAGEGRPDKPETTGGKITGNEPNGTFYNATNGGGGGAYLWHKQAGKWTVIYGDTGYKRQTQAVNIKQGYVALRRVNNTVECHFSGGPWGGISFYGQADRNFKRKSHAKRMDYWVIARFQMGLEQIYLSWFLSIMTMARMLVWSMLAGKLTTTISSFGLLIMCRVQTWMRCDYR